MFSWISIYEEAATKLLQFKDRNHELVLMLERMKTQGLKAMPLLDKDASGRSFLLEEIDPFTFLANFNRGIRDDNRIELWRFLKN